MDIVQSGHRILPSHSSNPWREYVSFVSVQSPSLVAHRMLSLQLVSLAWASFDVGIDYECDNPGYPLRHHSTTTGFDNGTAESVRVVVAFWASSSVAYSTIPHPLDRPVLNSVMICACTYYLSSLSHVILQCLPRQSPTQVPFGIIRCRNRQWMWYIGIDKWM